MYALGARTGRLRWRYATGAPIKASPSFAYGVYAFSARSGAVLWNFGTGSYVYASPAVWHGLVLVGSYDHTFYALDGIVYLSSFDHRTYGLLGTGGRLRAEWPDGEYSAAVAGNGRLYLVGLGRIYALAPLRPGR